MAEKTILGRIIQKHDIEANWNLATDFIPKQGEIIVYDIDENYTYERFKIGDGVTDVNNLPFTSATPDWSVNDPNAAGYIENRTHWIGTAEAPLTFDEDMTGKEVVEMGGGAYFVKMSDVPKTAEELIGSTLIIKQSPEDFNDYSGPIFELVIDETNIYKSYESDTGSMISVIINYNSGSDEAYVASVWGDLSETGLPLSDGVYFIYVRSGDKYEYAHSLSCLTGLQEVVHKLDKKYLPDFVSTVNGQAPDTNGNIDIDSAAIIDITEFPTENINESAIYRLTTGQWIANRAQPSNDDDIFRYIRIVDGLPEVGETMVGEMGTKSFSFIVYYNKNDQNAYVYMDETLGLTPGWYTIEQVFQMFGGAFYGIITDINDDPCDDNLRLLITQEYYIYDHEWVKTIFAQEKQPLVDIQWDGWTTNDKDEKIPSVDFSKIGLSTESGYSEFFKISDEVFNIDQLEGMTIDTITYPWYPSTKVITKDILDTDTIPGAILESVDHRILVVYSSDETNSAFGLFSDGFTNGTYFEYIRNDFHNTGDITYTRRLTKSGKITKIDSKYLDVTVPTKTSELTNDSGFITASDIPDADVPTKISELENDAGYLNTTTGTDGYPTLRLPEATTITSSMVLGLHGDAVSISGGSGSAAISIAFEDTITVTGDMQVQAPTNDGSVVNKKYIDDCFEDVAIPSNVSAFTNDAGYLNTTTGTDGNPELRLPEMTTIASSMYLGLHGDGVSITDNGNTSSIVLDGMGGAQLNGDFHVQTPVANESIANKKYVDDSVAGLVDSAPATLNTLKELSAALGNDENFATTVATQIGNLETEIESVESRLPTAISSLRNDSGYITIDDVANEVYVGDGDMPEDAKVQFIMDGSDEEELLKDGLIEYINLELAKKAQASPKFANDMSECTDTSTLYVLPNGNICAYAKGTTANRINQYQVALDAGKVTYNKRYNNGSWGTTKGFVLIDVDGLDFSDKSSYIVRFWGNELVRHSGMGVYGQVVFFVGDTYSSTKWIYDSANSTSIAFKQDGDGYYVDLMDAKPASDVTRCYFAIAVADGTDVGDSNCQDLFIEFEPLTTYTTEYSWHDTGLAYANYMITDDDINNISEKVDKKINSAIYVDGESGNDSNTGSQDSPLKTIQKAINSGAKIIYCKPGTYNENITLSNVHSVKLIAQWETYESGNRPKVRIDHSTTLTPTDNGNGLKTLDLPADVYKYEHPLLYNVFVTKQYQPTMGSGINIAYLVSLWNVTEEQVSTHYKLVPVMTLEECQSTEETFFYDGTTLYIHSTGSTFKIVSTTKRNKVENCSDIVFEDIAFDYCYYDALAVNNSNDIIFRNCEFSHSSTSNGLATVNMNGELYNCEAYRNRNDGLNFHDFGETTVYNCIGAYNYDDGISHHDGCTGSIHGGQYHHNGKGGVSSPTYGAVIDVYNTIMHNNQYGIYAYGGTADRQIIINGCYIHNNTYGIGSSYDLLAIHSTITDNSTNTSGTVTIIPSN